MRRQRRETIIFFASVFLYFILYFLQVGLGLSGQAEQARVCAGRRNSVAGRTPARQESEQSADEARKSRKGSAADTQVCLLRVPSSTSGLEITQ